MSKLQVVTCSFALVVTACINEKEPPLTPANGVLDERSQRRQPPDVTSPGSGTNGPSSGTPNDDVGRTGNGVPNNGPGAPAGR